MSLLALFNLFLCISTAFGGNQIKYESKSAKNIQIDTILRTNDHINRKEVKNYELKDSSNPKGLISVLQKPKRADIEIESNDKNYKGSLNIKINKLETVADNTRNGSANVITIMANGIDTGKDTMNQDKRIAGNQTNTITILTKKSEPKDTELKLNDEGQKIPVDLTEYNNLIIEKSARKRNSRSTKGVVSKHNNLLSVLIDVINRLIKFRGFGLSEQGWNVVSRLFESFLSVLFGPNINIWWPMFTRVLVAVMKLLT